MKLLFPSLEQLTYTTSRSQQDLEDEIDRKFSSAWNSTIETKTLQTYKYDDTEDMQVSKVLNNTNLDDSIRLTSKEINAASSQIIPRLVIRSDIFV